MEDVLKNQRNTIIDVMKGISIIAICLYHFGGDLLPYGYLGVDVFLTISGYLLAKQLIKQISSNTFNYWCFLKHKLNRLWLPILICAFFSLVIGYFVMLPDDYQELSESVVASSFFSNNILLCITTGDYWNAVNAYKPLMHLWYVGILMQTYVLLPLLYSLTIKMSKNIEKGVFVSAFSISVISISLFLVPSFPSSWKFYYLPFRLFEISMGSLAAIIRLRSTERLKQIGVAGTIVLIITMFCSRTVFVSSSVMLLFAVCLSVLCLVLSNEIKVESQFAGRILVFISNIGKRSYSIYLCHQFIFAFLFYSIFSNQNALSFFVYTIATVAISLLSYKFIEMPLAKNKQGKRVLLCGIILSIVLSSISLGIFNNQGVVRNVPEMDVYMNDVKKNVIKNYIDKPYEWDKDFENDGRIKILIIGDSFGRDWANILREWDKDGILDISYIYPDNRLENKEERIADADFVFCSRAQGIEMVKKCTIEDRIYVIGHKNYGKQNGVFYFHRNSPGYFEQSAEVSKEVLEENARYALEYGDHFINLLDSVKTGSKSVRVFTDDGRFISYDGRHLTQAGAQYYSRVLDIPRLLHIQE